MMTTEELGHRLRQARERAGRTQEEAASVLGLDSTAIVKIERGRRGVGAIELKHLATLYGVSVTTLLEDGAGASEITLRVALRTGEAIDRRAHDLVERLARIIADDRWLRGSAGDDPLSAAWIPIVQAPGEMGSGYERGYQAAEAFRKRFALGASPIRDVGLLADEVGVLVSRMPLGVVDAPDGCSALDPVDGGAYVLINSDKPRVRRRFTIAHELGHLALGHLAAGDLALDDHLGSGSWQEVEANAFAAGLLMPREGVGGAVKRLRTRLGDGAGPLERVVWLAESFGVSEEAATYRLANLGLGDDPVANRAEHTGATAASSITSQIIVEAMRTLKERPADVLRIRVKLGLEPVLMDNERGVTEVGPAMRGRVAKALEEGAITIERAASILHVPLPNVYRWVTESGIRLGPSSPTER